MKKKILFRADGNATTGLGHLYRLFSLVETVKFHYEFTFLTSETSNLEIIPKAYNLVTIPKHITLSQEPQWLNTNFPSNDYMIIADGYQFTSAYQKAIKINQYKLIYIDDLATEHMYADVVINHSAHIQENDFSSENYTKFALGTNYALLRPQFLKEAKAGRTISKIDSAFVCFGGADTHNLCFKYTQALLGLNIFKKIHVIVGAAYKHNEIVNLKANNKDIVEIHKNLSAEKLIELMKNCNFAVVPTSTILFEILCVKMPVYSGYFVENQKKAYQAFKDQGIVGGNGNMINKDDINIKNDIEKFIKSCNINTLIKKQEDTIDGLQSIRHLKIINNVAK
ncbi:UDP-2,4-diacetamido-2,4,6-trideoxy-beta-L-altropyranose hydrolase [Lacinutrix chionoecetis]